MLDEILITNQYVIDNLKYVKINYDKTDTLINELKEFNNVHYLTKVPYAVYDMEIKDLINFLLIYDAIDFSFFGDPKWTIKTEDKYLDGGIALLHCIFNLFKNRDSVEVYKYLEKMTLNDFKNLLKGNVLIPLLEERYQIVNGIAKIVNASMHSNFYDYVKDMKNDQELFDFIIKSFPSFKDERDFLNRKVYYYKLAQLLTSDILHVYKTKEHKEVDYSNLVGCADYKIPQVLESLGILEYSDELLTKILNKEPILENSRYEIEIRSSMLIVIDYLYQKLNQEIKRIDINDFIWCKGQDKSKILKPYHLTRTTTY